MPELEILVNKFWSGTISHDELKQLEKLLQQQQSGSSAPGFVAQGANTENTPYALDEKKADQLLEKIYTNISDTGTLRKKQARIGLRLASIAASITLIIACTWLWTRKEAVQQTATKQQLASIAVLKHTENTTDTIVNMLLPDGSTAMLYPKSKISYYVPFIHNKRDIHLTGAAEFNVSADRLKPFTVYANGIATTALGTRFKVDVVKKQVHISLYEGKVMIQSATGGNKAYLHPGQQLYVAKDFDYTISEIQPAARLAVASKEKKVLPQKAPLVNAADTINLSFRNAPLSDVFDNLAKKFQVHINYTDRAQLQQIPFTGHINANDSLESLLKVLCGMNNLQYQLAGDEVNISHP